MKQIYIRATVAVMAGIVFNFLGDWLLGVRIEIFRGIETFNFIWMLDVFIVPFITGLLVSKIYVGRAGKWLACLPPLFVRSASYVYLYFSDPHGDFYFNLHLYYWGPCVILAVESSNFGGILGDVLVGAYRKKDAVTEEVAAPPAVGTVES